MTIRKYVNISLPLTLAGVCFSGYLSGVKLFSGNCAFGESCPVFLGYPACYFGFVIFATMFIGTLVAFLSRPSGQWPVMHNMIFSGLGVLFSGYFVGIEIFNWLSRGFEATFFGLSTCAYGLAFFLTILIFSVVSWGKVSGGQSVEPAAAPEPGGEQPPAMEG